MKRLTSTVLLILVLVFVITLVPFVFWKQNYLSENIEDYSRNLGITLSLGKTFSDVVVVQTAEEMTLGLGGRENLEEDTGMLFVFAESDFYGIWMKDMLFSIDIIWLDENFKVVHIAEDVHPDSYPEVFSPNKKAKYVFEVVAGTVENSGIFVGQEGKIFW